MIHNFNAGPSILPDQVLQEAAQAVLNFNDTGLSILEIGHRTPLFEAVLDEARSLVRELMSLGSQYEILFLHGGGTTQFMQVPMNLLDEAGTAAYIDTGVWSSKAISYAKLFGRVKVLASSQDANYTYIPKNFSVDPPVTYLHITTNNTIYGTEWHRIPDGKGVPLVADMSSDIMSRVTDFSKFDLIYAGAQKNMGAAGVTLVVLKKSLLGKVQRKIPGILDYQKHIEAGSMLNTPPVFAIYVTLLTLRWLKAQGGVAAMDKANTEKAGLLYDALDRLPVFKPTVVKEDRSRMNACFVMKDPALEQAFAERCKQEGMYGVKGHRSVGGFRISLYNALPLSSVKDIVALMEDFAKTHG
ncbi:3-phosphoserine/phosphohydroxythreonine transaminase [Dinghuibacter silviterrae]|uniref:Phosphoserine aminotransferase n=1 Tax=Dinghuibacter silviterrae TaxID=1539049 RepID=A0A4R8DQ55_9BACT|nr:3-phosphoserine/phosphohydroxythreonine transaminase [Dinghuibacter silviterrae]TDW99897.1 phosphoserine aminotransferase [Dinghuibacter silviterrae]